MTLPANSPEPTTPTDNLLIYGQQYDNGERQVIVAGLSPESIRLATDDAYEIGRRLIRWSGKVPTEKKSQKVSEYIRGLAELIASVVDDSSELERNTDERACTTDVLRFIAVGIRQRGLTVPSRTALGRALRVLGIEMVRSNGERFYSGIALTSQVSHSALSVTQLKGRVVPSGTGPDTGH